MARRCIHPMHVCVSTTKRYQYGNTHGGKRSHCFLFSQPQQTTHPASREETTTTTHIYIHTQRHCTPEQRFGVWDIIVEQRYTMRVTQPTTTKTRATKQDGDDRAPKNRDDDDNDNDNKTNGGFSTVVGGGRMMVPLLVVVLVMFLVAPSVILIPTTTGLEDDDKANHHQRVVADRERDPFGLFRRLVPQKDDGDNHHHDETFGRTKQRSITTHTHPDNHAGGGKGPRGLVVLTSTFILMAEANLNALIVVNVETSVVHAVIPLHDTSRYHPPLHNNKNDSTSLSYLDHWINPLHISTCWTCRSVYIVGVHSIPLEEKEPPNRLSPLSPSRLYQLVLPHSWKYLLEHKQDQPLFESLLWHNTMNISRDLIRLPSPSVSTPSSTTTKSSFVARPQRMVVNANGTMVYLLHPTTGLWTMPVQDNHTNSNQKWTRFLRVSELGVQGWLHTLNLVEDDERLLVTTHQGQVVQIDIRTKRIVQAHGLFLDGHCEPEEATESEASAKGWMDLQSWVVVPSASALHSQMTTKNATTVDSLQQQDLLAYAFVSRHAPTNQDSSSSWHEEEDHVSGWALYQVYVFTSHNNQSNHQNQSSVCHRLAGNEQESHYQGNSKNKSSSSLWIDGPGNEARFSRPHGLVVLPTTNTKNRQSHRLDLIATDMDNRVLRRIQVDSTSKNRHDANKPVVHVSTVDYDSEGLWQKLYGPPKTMTANQDEDDDTTTTKTHSTTLVPQMVRMPDAEHPPVTHAVMQEACQGPAEAAAGGTEWRLCHNHELLQTTMTNTRFGDTTSSMHSEWPVTTTVWTATPCHGCRLSQPSPSCWEETDAATRTWGSDYFMATTVSWMPTNDDVSNNTTRTTWHPQWQMTRCLPRETNLVQAIDVGFSPNSSLSSQHPQVIWAACCVPMDDAPSCYQQPSPKETTIVVGIGIVIVSIVLLLVVLGMGVVAWYRGNGQQQQQQLGKRWKQRQARHDQLRNIHASYDWDTPPATLPGDVSFSTSSLSPASSASSSPIRRQNGFSSWWFRDSTPPHSPGQEQAHEAIGDGVASNVPPVLTMDDYLQLFGNGDLDRRGLLSSFNKSARKDSLCASRPRRMRRQRCRGLTPHTSQPTDNNNSKSPTRHSNSLSTLERQHRGMSNEDPLSPSSASSWSSSSPSVEFV